MADIIRLPNCDPSISLELSSEYMARDTRDWCLRRAKSHLEAAVQISRELGDSTKQVRCLELAAQLVNRYRRPRAVDLLEPRQMDLFVESA